MLGRSKELSEKDYLSFLSVSLRSTTRVAAPLGQREMGQVSI